MLRASRASAFILLISFAFIAAAQPPPSPPATETEASYRRARAVLDAAAKALAGEKELPGMDAISFQIAGTLYHRNQGLRAEGTPDGSPLTGKVAVDFKRNWMAYQRSSTQPGGFDFSNRWVRKEEEIVNYDLLGKYRSPDPGAATWLESAVLRALPQHYIVAAQQRAATLRWLGESEWNGARHNVIGYTSDSGRAYSLYVDAQTSLLSKVEWLYSDWMFGDLLAETILSGYTTVTGVPLPSRQVDRRGGVLTLDVRFSRHSLETPPDSEFAEWEGFSPAPQVPTIELGVRELAKDVYLVEGLDGGAYRVLFVVFPDFVAAVDAPLGDEIALTAIRLIHETAPGKPIRFVAPTHHHDDHAGGIRAFVAEGATILTTPGNTGHFAKAISARFTIQPDLLARSGRRFSSASQFLGPPIEGKTVIENGGRRMELINIGPGPHAQEMLVAWLPEEKILFQGDLLNRSADGELKPANDTTAHFYRWLKQAGLPVKILVGVHSEVHTLADLETTMRMRRERETP